MNSFSFITKAKKQQSAKAASLFSEKPETMKEKLQRQQIMQEINQGFEQFVRLIGEPWENHVKQVFGIIV